MDFLVSITSPEGVRQIVLIRAASQQAAEAAANSRWGGAGTTITAQGAEAFSPEYIAGLRNDPNTYFDASNSALPNQPGPEDPGGQNPPGQQPVPTPPPSSGQMPPSPPGEYLDTGREIGQYGAFLRGLGQRGSTTQGLLGSQNLRQAPAYESLYNANVALGRVPEGSGDTQYQNFVAGNRDPYGGSLEALRAIRNGVRPTDPANPASIYFAPGESDLGEVEALFSNAIRGAYGGAAGNFLNRFVDRARGQYFAAPQSGEGGTGGDFLDYLRRSLNLRGLFGQSGAQSPFGGGQSGGYGATRSF